MNAGRGIVLEMRSIRAKKSESILVRISPDDRALFELAAENIGLSTSSFIVNAAKRHAVAMLSVLIGPINLLDSIASGLNSDSTKRLDQIISILKDTNTIGGPKKWQPIVAQHVNHEIKNVLAAPNAAVKHVKLDIIYHLRRQCKILNPRKWSQKFPTKLELRITWNQNWVLIGAHLLPPKQWSIVSGRAWIQRKNDPILWLKRWYGNDELFNFLYFNLTRHKIGGSLIIFERLPAGADRCCLKPTFSRL